MSNFKKVIDFNKSFGLPHFDEEQFNILGENINLSNLRVDLCIEEIEELKEAFKTNNFIEVIDALTDELYVIYGAASSFGINIDNMISRFTKNSSNESNYNKLLNYNGKKIREFTCNLDYKKHLKTNNILENLLKDDKGNQFNKFLEKLSNLVDSLKKFQKEKNFKEVKETLHNLLYYTYICGILLNIDLDKSFEIVHNSNMSKLCSNEQEAKDTVEWYKINDNRYDSPNYRLSYNNQYWVVFNESTGKILKNKNYTPANFEIMLK